MHITRPPAHIYICIFISPETGSQETKIKQKKTTEIYSKREQHNTSNDIRIGLHSNRHDLDKIQTVQVV